MSSSRLFAALMVAATTIAAGVVACGKDPSATHADGAVGDASGGGSNADAAIDAPGSGIGSGADLGAPCTPGNTPQGTCPAGYECISNGGTGSWCSKRCAFGSGDTCHVGYTGPGYAACVIAGNGSGSGGGGSLYCGIVCEDAAGPPNLCGSGATCNGTCPYALQCKDTLGFGNQTIGSACE